MTISSQGHLELLEPAAEYVPSRHRSRSPLRVAIGDRIHETVHDECFEDPAWSCRGAFRCLSALHARVLMPIFMITLETLCPENVQHFAFLILAPCLVRLAVAERPGRVEHIKHCQ